ncbi:hypothetical protein [Flavisolibacter tropicus]|uniref:Phosphoribosylpyrophosphate synthetase n=1 Tax=Flavisolibacter tropicus TaxID=1492898 RepID=A0A172U195_9BACT|nr:hypothetical protein [Flavisolibacter tropicus]ANE53026.1 hypothetical protein SY85_23675 [Flavisolibacter tropicus]
MESPHLMNTLSNVIHKLQKKGLGNDFKWNHKGFTLDGKKYYQPHELSIIKIYRFEEFTNPDDLCVLYLIETNDHMYGYILDTYGVYMNHTGDFNNALRLIPERQHDDQLLFEL